MTLYTTVSAFKSVATQMNSFGAVHFDLCTSVLFVQRVMGEYYSGVSVHVEVIFGFRILNVCFQDNTNERSEFHNIGSDPFQTMTAFFHLQKTA